jgi:hypothetical protein
MMSKIAAFYYSQTGQGKEILQSICLPLQEAGYEVVYKEIVPETTFPFPWSSDAFFQAFPESRQGIPCPIQPLDLNDISDVELVIIAYQSWFLSPSIPLHGFFQNADIQQFLKNKSIVTINGCRNMWIMAQLKVKSYIESCGGKLVGNIVLQDRYHNLVSVITIIRWLMYGKKERSGIFPAAGVSAKDIAHAELFGRIIAETLASAPFSTLQEKLLQHEAIQYKPAIAFVEKTGHRIFGVFSKWVLQKGTYAAPERVFRLRCFKYYLFFVLYLVSPIVLFFFYLAYPFRYRAIRKDKLIQSNI